MRRPKPKGSLSTGRGSPLLPLHIFLLLALSCAPSIASAAQSRTLTLAAVGDIMLDRGVGQKIERYGTGYPFEHVGDQLARADIAFGNLESILAEECARGTNIITFKAKPRYAQALAQAGFDVLSLANNHSADCGRTGLQQTIANLLSRGIRPCGAGKTPKEAERPNILSVKGLRIAFLAFSTFSSEGASLTQGAMSIARASDESVRRAAAARPQADLVVASFHWGQEYVSHPGDEQVRLAHAAVEAGADLVIGHHTHVLQGLQIVRSADGTRRSLIAYSLGNFVFDAPRAWDKRLVESVVLHCRLSADGLESAEVVPVVLDGYRPRPADNSESQAILARLARLSAKFGTEMRGRSIVFKD
jgi:poly-gamma-glutamate capsule biosynthesis protein CapA/YwtB (metallophosphatase superfamily)